MVVGARGIAGRTRNCSSLRSGLSRVVEVPSEYANVGAKEEDSSNYISDTSSRVKGCIT